MGEHKLYNVGDYTKKWRYQLKQFAINGDDVPTERVTGIEIYSDYEKNAYPILKVTIVLEPSRYYTLIDSKDSATIQIRLQKYYMINDSNEKSMADDYINDTFQLILDDNDQDLGDLQQRNNASQDFKNLRAGDLNDMNEATNEIELFLYKSDVVKAMNTTSENQVFKDVTIGDLVGHVFTKAGIDNVLMTPPNNTESYDTVMLPSMPLMKALRYLDSYYGIYENGSMMFFDIDRTYVLNYRGECSAWEPDEIKDVQVIIPSATKNHVTDTCTVERDDDTETYFVVGDYRTLNVRNDSISNDIISSNNIQYISNYSGEHQTDKIDREDSNKTTDLHENRTENQYIGSTYTSQTSDTGNTIELVLSDYDVDMVKPNKKYNTVFEDQSINGDFNSEYMLVNKNTSFIKDGDDFKISTIIRLKETIK